jgi:hypothetical protein
LGFRSSTGASAPLNQVVIDEQAVTRPELKNSTIPAV